MARDPTEESLDPSSSKAQEQRYWEQTVYSELRKLAAAKLAHEPPGQTLQATALVHDVYLRLAGGNSAQWDSKGHFFAAAAEAMRRILIEKARRKKSQKAGGDFDRIELSESNLVDSGPPFELLALDEALSRLEEQSPRKAKLVKLRFFGGLTIDEAAAALGIAPSTAIADWAYAKGWLNLELSKGHSP